MTLAESWHIFRRNSRKYMDLPLELNRIRNEAVDTITAAERQGRPETANRLRAVVRGIDADLVTWRPFANVIEQDRMTLATLDYALPSLGEIQKADVWGTGFWEGLKSTPIVGSLVWAGEWLEQKARGYKSTVESEKTAVYMPIKEMEGQPRPQSILASAQQWFQAKAKQAETPSVWDILGIPWYVWLGGGAVVLGVMVMRR